MGGDPVVRVSGKLIGSLEKEYMMDSVQAGHLTGGKWNGVFSHSLARYLKVRGISLTNSGSSSNLLALSALTSPHISPERRLETGDVVVSTASNFPTTVAPIYQAGLVPYFCDIRLGTYNIDIDELEGALRCRPKAIILAHTLGNPFNISEVLKWCARNNVWLIEDNCDALGAMWRNKKTGSFGVYSTFSFYPAHHITTGEGGAVASYNGRFKRILESFRDWGRDCWCEPGEQDTCNQRFSQQHGRLPYGYDHKYTYTHLGYNMKMTEMQAACGAAQMQRIGEFVQKRRENFDRLDAYMRWHEQFFILPWHEPEARPSWFGYPITIREGAPFTKNDLVAWLENSGIATRPIFAGNILRQPMMKGRTYHVSKPSMVNADYVMNNSFWVGVWPGLDAWHIDYMGDMMARFLRART